ncbi:coiled-coil domain-containing protein 124 [Phtheirospermum japonicum]|uniref:Coiled-coil domain-containing protein 124 n=1 Tax=Phtheirospermum japonicum TaxID=374723 RepID=A0A830D6C9_9LAMI|nr:coiled-coil domain-containing protein 124 [Phtheirospermum japonicum]
MELIGTAPRRHKVTEAELQRRREEAFAALQRVEEKRKKGMCRCVDDKEYRGMVCVANTNRVGLDVDARNVDEALAQLTLPEDRHPERRIMAFFKAFKETQLERLKQEKPGLTLSHYEDAIFKLWKKSPDKLQANGGLSKLNQTSTQTRQQ